MLKQWTTYFLCTLLVAYFLLAGMGANVMAFCCSACAEEGIEHVVHSGCLDIHASHVEDRGTCCCHHSDACEVPIHGDDACQFWRITLSDVLLSEVGSLLPHVSCLSLFWMECLDVMQEEVFVQSSIPQMVPLLRTLVHQIQGQTMLSRHCVFLI